MRWFKKLYGLIARYPQFELRESSRAQDGTRPRLRAQESVAELASGEAASGPWKGQRFGAAKDPLDNVVLNDDLKSLRGPSREIPPLLDGVKLAFGGNSLQKFWAKYIRRCNRILN